MAPETTDIAKRLARCEARLAAHDAIERALGTASTMDGATRGVLEALGEHLGWRCAFSWRPGDDGRLRMIAAWAKEGCEPIVERRRALSFERGRGLVGRVFETGESAWSDDERGAELAMNAFAVPIAAASTCVGVLELFRSVDAALDEPSLDLVRGAARRLAGWSAAVLAASPDAIVSIDLGGSVRELNPAAERVFGVRREAAIGRRLTELIPPDLREAMFTGFIRDVTERGRAAEEREALLSREHEARVAAEKDRADLERANALKDEFLATVSHELRTPLQAILGWATMLRSAGADRALAAKAAEVIERNSNTQARLIADVLDISRIVNGTLKIARSPLEVATVLEAAVEALRPIASAKAITVDVDIDCERAVVEGDPDRLQQVFGNLLANAVKFTGRGGRIDVCARVDRDLEISVTDTGEGIAAEFLPHVFDRFRQADGRIARRHGGLGLGLAIARHLIELHGGAIYAASEGAGRGATFTIRLPVMDGGIDRAEAPSRARITGVLEGVRVLAVDDEADARELLVYGLSRAGAFVAQARNATEALEAFDQGPFDVVVSDIGMPDVDGFELAERWRALERSRTPDRKRTPFLAVSAFAGQRERDRARQIGFAAYLAKPISPDRVVDTVARLLATPDVAVLKADA